MFSFYTGRRGAEARRRRPRRSQLTAGTGALAAGIREEEAAARAARQLGMPDDGDTADRDDTDTTTDDGSNEEVVDGKSEVGGHPVERRPMRQWMLRITAYADRLIDELDGLDWPDSIKLLQRNWIGRSEGAEVTFTIEGSNQPVRVFTTRPDTLFGASYVVLAPEHPLVSSLTSPDQQLAVTAFCDQAVDRLARVRPNTTAVRCKGWLMVGFPEVGGRQQLSQAMPP